MFSESGPQMFQITVGRHVQSDFPASRWLLCIRESTIEILKLDSIANDLSNKSAWKSQDPPVNKPNDCPFNHLILDRKAKKEREGM